MQLISKNPYNQKVVGKYNIDDQEKISAKIDEVNQYFCDQPFDLAKRKDLLNRIADTLQERKDDLALLITREMGKVISESYAEIDKCTWVCKFYADNSDSFLKDKQYVNDDFLGYVKYQPIGLVLAIMPWNFPFWQVFRFAAPAFMAGNGILLKHASNVTGCALAIQDIFFDVVKQVVFSTLVISSKQVAEIIDDDRVKAVSLTGSEYAGSQVAQKAASKIKKSVLELGGSDPFIVFSDADLDLSTDMAIASRYLNCGQSCIGAKRFIIHKNIYSEFLSLFKAKLAKLKVGDPEDPKTKIGPLAQPRFLEELKQQITDAEERGGKLFKGAYFTDTLMEPGLIENITKDSKIFREEVFGPIASFYEFSTKEEAIEIANCTEFGLGSSVWTQTQDVIDYCIDNLDVGAVFVNDMVKSDPRLPFGGVKKSGYGRELARDGMLEFMNHKTVVIPKHTP